MRWISRRSCSTSNMFLIWLQIHIIEAATKTSSFRWRTKALSHIRLLRLMSPSSAAWLRWISCSTSSDRAVHISASCSWASCWCLRCPSFPQDSLIPHLPTCCPCSVFPPWQSSDSPPACTPAPRLPVRSLLTIAAVSFLAVSCLPVFWCYLPLRLSVGLQNCT